ncbi:MAG TPA: MFS transporter [Bryobacteraceae bacterium]|nr:MFS transporter [Bryobacteraceae bacterium]
MVNIPRTFYGWWIVAAAVCTFGLSTGLPYYNMPFFYDYYAKEFGWSRPDITLGFPLAALFTLWVGPLLVHRFPPKRLLMIGSLLTAIAFIGFSTMKGSLPIYYALWFIYAVGYIFSGPIPHQILISQWFKKNRSLAMGVTYVGVGLVGSAGAYLVKYLTASTNFHTCLLILGFIVLLVWPITIFFVRNRPQEIGQNPDGAALAAAETKVDPLPFRHLTRTLAFWLLVIGSACSIGSIGSINQHMKFVFQDQGYTDQIARDAAWTTAQAVILWSSIAGRLLIGWLADRYPKKYVMTATYVLVAATIPLLLLVRPGNESSLYLFAVLFGFGMGADYMLIPLMAAEQFGVNTLARAMAIILPTDTIGQTWFPYFVSRLRQSLGSYDSAMMVVFAMAFIGAVAISLLPKQGIKDDALPVVESRGAALGD